MSQPHSTRSSRRGYRAALAATALCISCLFAATLLACDAAPGSGGRHLVRDIPSRTETGLVNVVVEIPAGSDAKWEVVKQTGQLEWEGKDGRPRTVDYLPYPGNYGMVPRTRLPKKLGGDGDPLDVIILGPAVERGSVVPVRLIGVLELLDRGEQDDKLIAVQPGTSLGDVSNLAELDARYAGVSEIVQLWFANYKGPGKMQAKGFGDPARATEILESAIAAYAAAMSGAH